LGLRITPFVIRWGPDGWSDMLRRHGRCSKCGQRGLTLSRAGWGGNDVGWEQFPVDRMAPLPREL